MYVHSQLVHNYILLFLLLLQTSLLGDQSF
jgi:hypothetical protein